MDHSLLHIVLFLLPWSSYHFFFHQNKLLSCLQRQQIFIVVISDRIRRKDINTHLGWGQYQYPGGAAKLKPTELWYNHASQLHLQTFCKQLHSVLNSPCWTLDGKPVKHIPSVCYATQKQRLHARTGTGLFFYKPTNEVLLGKLSAVAFPPKNPRPRGL